MKKELLTKPTPKNVLESELCSSSFARMWRGLEIHFVKKDIHPNTINEVNRISTIMFNLDYIDSDIFDDTYRYIVVYDRGNGEIVSFYRYILCKDAIYAKHDIRLSTAMYFNFSEEFVEKILPVTIEFGRSVVNKTAQNYQAGLQAIWIGLGILVYTYCQHATDLKIKYLFGKFSLQWNVYTEAIRNMILFLYQKHFPSVYDTNGEIYIKPRFEVETPLDFTEAAAAMNCNDYKADRKILLNHLTNLGLPMPKLADSYANIGGLSSFGTISNDHLNSWETGILCQISRIDPAYIKKFVDGYVPINTLLFL